MRKYSVFALAREAMRAHKGWDAQWASPEPREAYDVIIIGAGGHGLATAYYLAKEHGITNVAVLEKGWLGGGNTGRNTTIIRSNYLYDESAGIYDHALKLWDGLSQDLNYNVMYSARGVMMLAHNVHDIQVLKRHVHANRLNGIDNEFLSPEQAKEFCPPLNISQEARYPVMGAALQRRGGTARHDAVAWGYARAASDRGVHIIQNCEVTGIKRGVNGEVTGVDTSRGFIGAKKVGVVAAGHSSVVMNMAGVRMPLESYPLQALVSEPVKPCFPVRGHVEHGACLYLAVGQGRAGHRRGDGSICVLFADRRAAHFEPYAGCDLRNVPDVHPHENAAELGRHCRRDA